MSDTSAPAAAIRAVLPGLPAAERRVARVLLADYPVAGLETVAELARRSGSSGPTVLRLLARLGYSGYPSFQRALRAELADQHRSPLRQYEHRPLAGDVVSRAREVYTSGLSSTFGDLSRPDLDPIVALLADQRRPVVCVGGRFSDLLARYIAQHLQQLRPGVTHVSLADRATGLLDVNRRHVVLAFDFRRYETATITFGRRASRQGGTVVVVTDPWMSPLAAFAQHVLVASVDAPSPFDSLVPALAVTETVIAALVERLGDTPRERIARFDDLWAEQRGPDGLTDGTRDNDVVVRGNGEEDART